MERLNLFESNILLWIQENLRTDVFDALMPIASAVNNAGILSILTVILLLLFRRYRMVGAAVFGSLATEFVLVNLLLKNAVARIRPYVVNERLCLLGALPNDYSFPSGHTGSAFAVATVLFLCSRKDMFPKRYGALALAAALLIAASRLYNAAHYPTDVLGGMLIGLFTGLCACKILAVCRRGKKLGD